MDEIQETERPIEDTKEKEDTTDTMTMEQSEQLAQAVRLTLPLLMSIPLENWKTARKGIKHELSVYELMGPTQDGAFKYQAKLKHKEASLRRLDAMVKFIEVSHETEDDIAHGGDS